MKKKKPLGKREIQRNNGRRLITFRSSLIALLLFDAILPVTLLGIVSLGNITSLARTRFDESVQRKLSQINSSIDGIIGTLVDTSQLLAFDPSTIERVEVYYSNDLLYNRLAARSQVEKQIFLMENTDKNLAIAYYNQSSGIICGKALKVDFGSIPSDVLVKRNWISINGVHGSCLSNQDFPVISSSCLLKNTADTGIRIYIESNISPVLQEMDSTIFEIPIVYLIVNDKGIICYSGMNALYRQGETFEKNRIDLAGHYKVFSQENNNNFTTYAIVKKSLINNTINNWIQFCIIVLVLSSILGLIIAFIIWRVITKPLSDFTRELTLMVNDNIYIPRNMPRVRELSAYIEQFDHLRKQVWELLDVVRLNAQREANWEVEKLLYQINPHFLHNTLDIIRWKAKIKGDDEIETIVNSLNSLLHYNLSKGSDATLNEEINAVRAYIRLQNSRFEFQYTERIKISSEDLKIEIPRFVIQPLVENAILHGLNRGQGTIALSIYKETNEKLTVQIEDDGIGMTDEQVCSLMKDSIENTSASSFGIGVSYVIRVLKKKFGSTAAFQINSMVGIGTQVVITIPVTEEERRTNA